MSGRLSVIAVIFIVAAVLVTISAAFIVDQREQVLVLQFGEPIRVIQEPVSYTHLRAHET